MKITTSACQIPFHNLHTLFDTGTGPAYYLKPCTGNGFVHFFNLEQGLQARLWDCSFTQAMDMYCEEPCANKRPYYTIAFFLHKEELQFANNELPFQENIIWDTLFISSNSSLRMYIPPGIQVVSLNISFSEKWLQQHIIESSKAYAPLKEKLFSSKCVSLLEYMSTSEKKVFQELVEATSKKSNGSFYIKSIILKMITDFFEKLKGKETLTNCCNQMNALLAETEKLLSESITGTMPNIKHLACQYGISEVSLKRHFKQRYGVNMSTYYIHKKMEYAQQIMQENDLSEADAAKQLGYKNVSHFTTMLQKYTGTIQLHTTGVRHNEIGYNQVV